MPSGMPASFVSAANSSVLAEVNSDGLTMTAQPAASAAAHFQADEQKRRIPGRQRRNDTDRFMRRVGEGLRLIDRYEPALELVDQTTEIPPPFRMVAQLSQHLGHQLAVVPHLDLGETLGIRGDEIAELAHGLAACRRRHLRPRAPPHRLVGRLDGLVGIGLGAARDLRPRFAAIGIDRLEPFIVCGIDIFAVDKELVSLHDFLRGRFPAILTPQTGLSSNFNPIFGRTDVANN